MSTFKIYLIEDEQKHVEETINKLRAAASERENGNTFEFEWMKGTVKTGREEYIFYEKIILEEIRKCIDRDKKKGFFIGLLLDTLLTQEDIERTITSYYARASIARDIFFQFYEEIPVYIITASSVFGSQSDIIMGKDLSGQYINQRRLTMNPLKNVREDTERLFLFYEEFYESTRKKKGVK